MNAAREGARMGNERELRFYARRRLGECGDLGRMAMAKCAVRVKVAVAGGVVSAIYRLAAGASTSRDATDEQRGFGDAGTLARRIAVEKQPGCPTCGVVTFFRCSGTAQVNCASRCGAPCACL